MQITRKDLGQIAENFLQVLDREGIHSLESLDRILDQRLDVDKSSGHVLKVQLRPSLSNTKAHTMSYIIPIVGIPIETRMNYDLSYLNMIIKTGSIIPGYSEFSLDGFGNIIQNKVINSSEWEILERELRALG